ncbi:MAG: GLUG motif-containing protein [Planctomycetota bacterium]|jgi:hypothetical protein
MVASRVLRTIPILITVCLVSFPAQAQYGGGTGEPNDPYLIYTAEQMNTIGAEPNDWDKHFRLMADIDLSAYTGTSFNTIGSQASPFKGVFDGHGKKILNFTYTSTATSYIGLFRHVSGEIARIKDLGLIDPNVDVGRKNSVGSLVGRLGRLQGGTITNCYVEGGSVSGWGAVGGLVGGNSYDGTITDCYVEGVSASGYNAVGGLTGSNYGTITNCNAEGASASGSDAVGGLVGGNDWYGTIADCYAQDANASGSSYVGGLVGGNADAATITNCHATGSVSSLAYSSIPVGGGGLVGQNRGTITDCTSSASVLGNNYAGGLVGDNSGTIANCYAASSVSGSGTEQIAGGFRPCGVGGLVGHNSGSIAASYSIGTVMGIERIGGLVGWNSWEGTVENCYSSGSVSGDELVGGLVGDNSLLVDSGAISNSFWDIETSGQATSNGGTGRTTAEMQMASTFTDAGWDFVDESVNGLEDIWSICEGTNHPRLARQIPAGDFVCPDGITVEDFVFFMEHRGDDNCRPDNDYCQGTDLDLSGTVDADDLVILVENWLQSPPIVPPQPPVPTPPAPTPSPKARGCFLADTPVWVNGELVQISNVVSGQMVGELHCDLPTDCLEQIEKVEEHEGTFECRDIVLESGNRISVVDAHCFMLDSGRWIAAQNLRSGQRLKTLRGTVGIKSVATRAAPFVGKVYNLKVAGVDRYTVGEDGIIVRDY